MSTIESITRLEYDRVVAFANSPVLKPMLMAMQPNTGVKFCIAEGEPQYSIERITDGFTITKSIGTFQLNQESK